MLVAFDVFEFISESEKAPNNDVLFFSMYTMLKPMYLTKNVAYRLDCQQKTSTNSRIEQNDLFHGKDVFISKRLTWTIGEEKQDCNKQIFHFVGLPRLRTGLILGNLSEKFTKVSQSRFSCG